MEPTDLDPTARIYRHLTLHQLLATVQFRHNYVVSVYGC